VLADLVDHALEALLELAPVLGAGHHARQVKGDHPLAGQRLRHVAVDDPLGDALDDGGLADPGITEEHRVVLGAPRQHLDGLLDLALTANHRVQPALTRVGGQVPAVLVQRRRAARAPLLPAAGTALQLVRVGQRPRQGLRRSALRIGAKAEQYVLSADPGRARCLGLAVCVLQGPLRRRRQRRRGAPRLAMLDRLLHLLRERVDRYPRPLQHLPGRGQLGCRPEQVLHVEIRAAPVGGRLRRPRQQLAGLIVEQPPDVHALHRRPAPTERILTKERREQVVEVTSEPAKRVNALPRPSFPLGVLPSASRTCCTQGPSNDASRRLPNRLTERLGGKTSPFGITRLLFLLSTCSGSSSSGCWPYAARQERMTRAGAASIDSSRVMMGGNHLQVEPVRRPTPTGRVGAVAALEVVEQPDSRESGGGVHGPQQLAVLGGGAPPEVVRGSPG
jgi:hypothetical protein